MNPEEAEKVLRFSDWEMLLDAQDGTTFAIKVDEQPVLAEKVFSEDKDDEDEDRDLTVVVRIGEQFFKRHGWSMVGSHCYGEYTPSWDSGLTEVFPHERQVTEYKTKE